MHFGCCDNKTGSNPNLFYLKKHGQLETFNRYTPEGIGTLDTVHCSDENLIFFFKYASVFHYVAIKQMGCRPPCCEIKLNNLYNGPCKNESLRLLTPCWAL